MKKSLSVRPSILCVQRLARTSPQRTYRSGWCCSSSATRATSLTKSTARTKFLNLNALVRRLSSSTVQPSSCARSGVIAARVKGGVPPRQGTHFLSASDSAIARPSNRFCAAPSLSSIPDRRGPLPPRTAMDPAGRLCRWAARSGCPLGTAGRGGGAGDGPAAVLLIPILQPVQFGVNASAVEQFAVGALFRDSPSVQDDDAVYMLNRRQAVGDNDGGPAPQHPGHRLLDQPFALGVDAARRLVQHEHDGGVERDGPCQGDQLFLPDREPRPALLHLGLVALRQGVDEPIRADVPRRPPKLL